MCVFWIKQLFKYTVLAAGFVSLFPDHVCWLHQIPQRGPRFRRGQTNKKNSDEAAVINILK